jgi:hypothetical protein
MNVSSSKETLYQMKTSPQTQLFYKICFSRGSYFLFNPPPSNLDLLLLLSPRFCPQVKETTSQTQSCPLSICHLFVDY